MSQDLTAASNDPRRTHPEAIQDPPPTLLSAFRKIGPGLILAAAIVGTGELIATTNLGAKAGFILLWLVIVSCFIKVFVQIELGRYAVSSGESTFASFRKLPGPGMLLVWWCAGMLMITQMQIGAMIGASGHCLHMVLPGASDKLASAFRVSERPELPWAVLITVVTAAMLATGSYRLIERLMTVSVVGFTTMTVVCVAFLPKESAISWEAIASGFSFRIPREALPAAFAMFGITGVGATELLTYPYWCNEKGYARFTGPRDGTIAWAERARGWMRVMRLDAWISMVVYTIATLAFYLMGAAVLHNYTEGEGLGGSVSEMLNVLVSMYEPVLGPTLARWFLMFGAFIVLYSTLFAATAGTSRLLSDFLRVNRFYPMEEGEYRKRWIRFLCVVLPFLSLGLFVTFSDPVYMVMIGGIMQAVTLPLIAAAAVFLRFRRTDRRLAPGKVWDALLWISMAGLAFAGLYAFYDIVLGG